MAYLSVDQIQKVLAEKVFHYTKDSKKASGRALGTLVEIITFYLLKSWGFENSISIENRLAEYGNPEITHNVEYTLHPIVNQHELLFQEKLPLTSTKLLRAISEDKFPKNDFDKKNNSLLTTKMILRNSCVIAKGKASHPFQLMANLISKTDNNFLVSVLEQYLNPYAMFECKRVGVEEGMRKGPQTIEKAKQGAYVAKMVSSLYKIRFASGGWCNILSVNS